MNFEEFDNSTSILSHLVSQYEADLENGANAYLAEEDFLHLVEYYDKEGEVDRALSTLSHALVCHPFSGHLYLRQAALLLQDQRLSDAWQTLEVAASMMPQAEEVLLMQSKTLCALEQYDRAFEILESLPPSIELYKQQADIYEGMQEYVSMFNVLVKALRIEPNHQSVLEKMWLCTELSKKYTESLALYEELLQRDAYASRAWYNLGQVQAYLGQYELAIDSFEYAYLIDEDFEFAYRDRAEMCYELKNYTEALQSYEEIIGLFEPDADLYLKSGQCHHYLGNITQARNYLAQAALLDAMQAEEIYYYLGLGYAAEANWTMAVSFYERAIALDVHREEYYFALAQAHQASNNYQSAAHNFRMATDTAPENALYWFYYAQFLMKQGYATTANEIIEEASFYTVESEWQICQVAILLLRQQQEEAFSLFNTLLEEDETAHRMLFTLMPDLKKHKVMKAMLAYHHIEL